MFPFFFFLTLSEAFCVDMNKVQSNDTNSKENLFIHPIIILLFYSDIHRCLINNIYHVNIAHPHLVIFDYNLIFCIVFD